VGHILGSIETRGLEPRRDHHMHTKEGHGFVWKSGPNSLLVHHVMACNFALHVNMWL